MGTSSWAGEGGGELPTGWRMGEGPAQRARPRALLGFGLWLQVFLVAFLMERNLELGF